MIWLLAVLAQYRLEAACGPWSVQLCSGTPLCLLAARESRDAQLFLSVCMTKLPLLGCIASDADGPHSTLVTFPLPSKCILLGSSPCRPAARTSTGRLSS